MKTIAPLAALNVILLVLGPLAHAGGENLAQTAGVEGARTRDLPTGQNPYVPLICLDSYRVVVATTRDFWHTSDEPECRPVHVTSVRDFQE